MINPKVQLLISGFIVTCLLSCGITVGASSFNDEKLFGKSSDDIAAQIIQTSDNGYAILATTYYDAEHDYFWFIKLDENKNLQWEMTCGGAQADTANTLLQTIDGGYVIAGTTASYGLGNSSFWLSKVGPLGQWEWDQTYGTTTSELDCMLQTNDNGYLLVGTTTENATQYIWLVKTDENGNQLWNQTVIEGSVKDAVETDDGGYLLAGTIHLPEKEYASDAWLIKTDPYGNLEWDQTYDLSELFDYGIGLVRNSDGSYTFAGMNGAFYSHDLWVVNVDQTGNVIWNCTFNTKETAYYTSLIKTDDQGYAVTGVTNSLDLPDSSRYLILVKLDQNGNVQYNKTHNSYGYYKNAFVTQTNNQNYAIAATTKTDENTEYNILFFTTQNTTQNSEDPIPDSPESMTFTSGVTLYSPLNTTYPSKLLTLNLTAVVGRGIDCTINYNIDNQHTGTVPYTFMFPTDLHIQNKVKGTVNLPELTEGTHNLTIQVECGIYDYNGVSPPGPPFAPKSPNSTDYIATWTDTIQFTINTNDQQIPEFSALTPVAIMLIVVSVVGTIYKTKLISRETGLK
ncbi:MAG: hypothetical protein NWF02_01040 [Candidatus Bathyarchaeota archaeon]|nr:hypothetical protein [Candidatus Bathyarchaeum sp.]